MKPIRLRLTHELVLSYNLHRKMTMLQSRACSPSELTSYHDPEYIRFLEKTVPLHTGTVHNNEKGMTSKQNANIDSIAAKYNLGEHTDCPIFEGLFNFCQKTCGASIDGAKRLNNGDSEICINWSGGLHHAKKSEVGFLFWLVFLFVRLIINNWL